MSSMSSRLMAGAVALALCLGLTAAAVAVELGQTDDFQDGTVQDWVQGLGGVTPTFPPENIADGGPDGAGDAYLNITAVGGSGPNSRLSVINATQWAGDYTTAGVGAIEMDLRNSGDTELYIRLLLEDPMGGPPADAGITAGHVLAVGSGWTHVTFAVTADDLTMLAGDAATLLAGTTAIRIFSGEEAAYPPAPVVGELDVDNIEAVAGSVAAQPTTWSGLRALYR